MKALEKKFAEMGIRVQVGSFGRRVVRRNTNLTVDVSRDKKGEFFDIRTTGEADLRVVDIDKKDRHLLLLADDGERKDKYLCGHDERHWFVCAVPGQSISSIKSAKESLKPSAVRQVQHDKGIKNKKRNRRRNKAFVRQGEWIFEPVAGINPKKYLIFKNEPISRGRGKPHICEELYREGGTTVYVCMRHRDGVEQGQYEQIIRNNPSAKKWNWQVMKRDPKAYVRGKISHSDHATIKLNEWHRVHMNTEGDAPAAQNVVFLD